jgi:hypothetical protein
MFLEWFCWLDCCCMEELRSTWREATLLWQRRRGVGTASLEVYPKCIQCIQLDSVEPTINYVKLRHHASCAWSSMRRHPWKPRWTIMISLVLIG